MLKTSSNQNLRSIVLVFLCVVSGYFIITICIPRIQRNLSDPNSSPVEIAAAENDYHKFSHAYSLWLQPAEPEKFEILQDEIRYLAKKYNGTYHQPHATLYGAIYTTNESYVLETARYLATVIKPLILTYDYMDSNAPRLNSRWRGGLTIRYKYNKYFTEAAMVAMGAVRAKACSKPHTSMLYDFDGGSYDHKQSVEESEKRLEERLGYKNLSSNFFWQADSVAVFYTPLRDHWKSSADMSTIVGNWKRVAVFPMAK